MTNPATQTLRALLFGLCLVTLTTIAQAQTNVWTGPAAGDWGDPVNWSLGVVPDIPVDVRIDSNVGQDSSVLLAGQQRIDSLLVDTGDALTIVDDASLAVGPVLNLGSIRILGRNANRFRGLRSVGTLVNAPGGLLSLDNGYYSFTFPTVTLCFGISPSLKAMETSAI